MCRLLKFQSILLFLLLAGSSCAKIELPSDDEVKTQKPAIEESDILTVAQAIEQADEMNGYDIAVKGYIVGYISGSAFSEKTSCFSLPTERANTNMLLADRKDETDYSKCLPVKLPAATTSSDFRGELNLYDHPDFFQRFIVVEGQLSDYFRVVGIVKIWDYYFPSVTPEEESPGPKPDTPSVSPPSLDETEQEVPEGR